MVRGLGFVFAGLVRIFLGARLPAGSKNDVVMGGVVTTPLGVAILAGWPHNSMIILGMLFGIDLIFYGASLIFLGLKLRI